MRVAYRKQSALCLAPHARAFIIVFRFVLGCVHALFNFKEEKMIECNEQP